jgi:hypothetical protein
MSRGLGRIQQGCLTTVGQYERAGKLPTTFNIAAEVYRVKRDKDGNRIVSDAQHVAVKRALEGLQRQGKLIGFRTDSAVLDGSGRTELCHHWMSEQRANEWLAEQHREMCGCHRPEYLEYIAERIARFVQKMQAIGMKPEQSGPASPT